MNKNERKILSSAKNKLRSLRSRFEREKFTLFRWWVLCFNDSHAATFSNLSEMCFQPSKRRIFSAKRMLPWVITFQLRHGSKKVRSVGGKASSIKNPQSFFHQKFLQFNNLNRHPRTAIARSSHSASLFTFFSNVGRKVGKPVGWKSFSSVRRRKIRAAKKILLLGGKVAVPHSLIRKRLGRGWKWNLWSGKSESRTVGRRLGMAGPVCVIEEANCSWHTTPGRVVILSWVTSLMKSIKHRAVKC